MLQSVSVEAQASRFAELWVLKEAYIKGLGVGLGVHPLDSFAFSFDDRAGLRCEEGGETIVPPWQFALAAPSAEYRLAVAVEIPLVNGRWTMKINAIGVRADPEILRSSGALSFGFVAPGVLEASVSIYRDAIGNAEPVGAFVNNQFAATTFACIS